MRQKNSGVPAQYILCEHACVPCYYVYDTPGRLSPSRVLPFAQAAALWYNGGMK